MFTGLVLLTLVSSCCGYYSFQQAIPNGDKIPHPCKPNLIWHGVGHKNVQGGGSRNPFGVAFEKHGKKWTKELCREDSDGDGRTNGQELGDPDCTWKVGMNLVNVSGLSHPGVCEPTGSPRCANNNQWEFCQYDELKCPQLNQPGVMNVTLKLAKTKIPPTETNYYCAMFDLPVDDEYHMIAFKPLIDNREVAHHIIMFGCSGSGNVSNEAYVPKACGMQVRGEGSVGCSAAMGGWTLGSPGTCLPDSVGIPFGKNGIKHINMQIHWNNPDLRSDYEDATAMVLYYVRKNSVKSDASTFVVGQRSLELKPGLKTTTETGVCSSQCTKTLAQPVKLLDIRFHMHYLGRAALLEHYRGGVKIRDIAIEEVFNYDTPVTFTLDPPVEFFPGDEMKIHCTFTTATQSKTIYFGEATSDEMCFAFLLYYPAQKSASCVDLKNGLGGSYCAVRNVKDKCSNMQSQSTMTYFTKMVPKVVAGCDTTGKECRSTCPQVIKEVRQNPCMAEDVIDHYEKILMLRAQGLGQMAQVQVKTFFGGMRSCPTPTSDATLVRPLSITLMLIQVVVFLFMNSK